MHVTLWACLCVLIHRGPFLKVRKGTEVYVRVGGIRVGGNHFFLESACILQVNKDILKILYCEFLYRYVRFSDGYKFFFLKKFLYWNIVDYKCCVSFR